MASSSSGSQKLTYNSIITIENGITGNAPNVSVTSTDGSLDITENSTPTSKTIDISVKRSFSDFVGTFSATLSNNVVVNSLVKTSGSMSISGTGVALPAGSYHVDVVCKAGTPTFTTNTSSALIIVNETATGRSFSFSANPNVFDPQMFAFGIDVKLTENKLLSISSLISADSSQEWTLNGTVFIHSINGISSGSSGSSVRGVWPVQTFSAGTLTATAGILYKGTAIANLTLALAAQEGGEYHIKFSTASTIGTFDLSAVTSWIGTAPTIAAGKTYELDILDGVGVIAEVS